LSYGCVITATPALCLLQKAGGRNPSLTPERKIEVPLRAARRYFGLMSAVTKSNQFDLLKPALKVRC
jgi:hypothetical protein